MNNEIFEQLSNMLGNSGFSSDFNNSENFKNVVNNFTNSYYNSNDSSSNSNFNFQNIDMETLVKIQNIMAKINSNQHSPRSNLLSSLKPYLKPSRQEKLDQYMQFINVASIMEGINSSVNNDKKGDSFRGSSNNNATNTSSHYYQNKF